MRRPDQPVTYEEGQVVIWTFLVGSLLVGIGGFLVSFKATPEQAEAAAQIRGLSLLFLLLSGLGYGAKKTLDFFFG